DDICMYFAIVYAGYAHTHPPVIDQQLLTGRNRGEDFRMRKRDRHRVPVRARLHEANPFARMDDDFPVAESADANFRALQVLQDSNGLSDLVLQTPNSRIDLRMTVLRSVAEVHAKCIDAREKQLFQHGRRGTCRADCCDDLGTSVSVHGAASKPETRSPLRHSHPE